MMTAQPLDKWPKWRDSLVYHLRMKDVPGDKIGDILLEADAHLRESGETPEDAFGDARRYADTRTDVLPDRTKAEKAERDQRLLVIALAAFAGTALYATGAQAIGASTDALFGLNGWIAFTIGAAILFIGLWRLPADFVRHPVTNEPMLGDMLSFRLVTAMVLIVIGAVFYFLGRFVGG